MSSDHSLETILGDPAAHFEAPEKVVTDPRWDREARICILRQWRQDLINMSRAANERMGDDVGSRIAAVDDALRSLGADIHV